MTTDATIREWARDQGMEPPQRGRLAPRWREQYAAAHPGEQIDDEQDQGDEHQGEGDDGPAGGGGEVVPAVPVDTGETRPQSPHPPRLLGGGRRTRAPRPKRPHRRVTLEHVGETAWGILAGIAGQGGMSPTAVVLGMQAPVAGVVLEETLRGTAADRVLQPIARMGDRAGAVVALLAPPVLVSMMSMQPHRAPQIVPALRGALRQWALIAGPAVKAREKREKRAAEALELPDGMTLDDLVEQWITTIFTPPQDAGEPVPDAA